VGVAISTAGRTILFSGVICALAITAMLVLRAAVFREITVSEAPSGKGEQVLASSFAPGAVSPMQIILTGPHENSTGGDASAAKALTETLEHDPRVAGVSERSSSAGVLLSVVTSVTVDSNSANALVRHIRQDLVPPLRAKWGATILVGGATGVMVDLSHETSSKFPLALALALILGASLLFLLVVFRSPLLAVKAILMNVLATAAMLGIIVYVFQNGHGQHVFAFTSTGFIQCFVPLTVFALVYGCRWTTRSS
jgi:putative drug exporter of the RND superfamily